MPDLAFLAEYLIVVLCVVTRITSFLVLAPVFSSKYIPTTIKAAMGLYMGVVLAPLIHMRVPTDIMALAGLMFTEALVGLLAGFAASLVFGAIQVAGQIADTEMGFGMMNVLDPMHGVPVPLMGSFLYLLSLLVYMAMDGHHSALLAIVRSYEIVPAGRVFLGDSTVQSVLARFGSVFGLGVQIALPVVLAMFLSTVAMGVIARAIPQINIFIMGMPIKIVLGGLVLALGMPVFVGALETMFKDNSGWIARFLETLAL